MNINVVYIIAGPEDNEPRRRAKPSLALNGLADVVRVAESSADCGEDGGFERFDMRNTTRENALRILKHMRVYRNMCDTEVSDDAQAMVIDESAELHPNFKMLTEMCMAQLPKDWDFLFVGEHCHFHIPERDRVNGRYAYRKEDYPTHWGGRGATRGMKAYIINTRCARRLVKFMDENTGHKIETGIDEWMNRVIRDLGLVAYWSEPTIVGFPVG
jgi:hypothetical protein